MRTRASLMPTSSFQIARTNFIASASNVAGRLLADEAALGQTFSTGALTATRSHRGYDSQHFTGPADRRLARRVSRDLDSRLAVDARQSDPAADPGDRRAADGPARR